MWYIHFFPSASQNVYLSFPSLSPATSWGCGGSRPSFKNRTRYYGGISKWPVKNKGVPRSSSLKLTPWPVFRWQLLFDVVGAKSVPDLRRNTPRPYSHRKDWKNAWKSGAHFGSQTRTSVQYVGLHLSGTKQALELWSCESMCYFNCSILEPVQLLVLCIGSNIPDKLTNSWKCPILIFLT